MHVCEGPTIQSGSIIVFSHMQVQHRTSIKHTKRRFGQFALHTCVCLFVCRRVHVVYISTLLNIMYTCTDTQTSDIVTTMSSGSTLVLNGAGTQGETDTAHQSH